MCLGWHSDMFSFLTSFNDLACIVQHSIGIMSFVAICKKKSWLVWALLIEKFGWDKIRKTPGNEQEQLYGNRVSCHNYTVLCFYAEFVIWPGFFLAENQPCPWGGVAWVPPGAWPARHSFSNFGPKCRPPRGGGSGGPKPPGKFSRRFVWEWVKFWVWVGQNTDPGGGG